jgi:hypothetical protein
MSEPPSMKTGLRELLARSKKDTERGDAKSPCSVYVPQLLPVDSPDLQQQTTDYWNKEKPR